MNRAPALCEFLDTSDLYDYYCTFVWAGESTAATTHERPAIKGKVLEVIDVGSYTYEDATLQ